MFFPLLSPKEIYTAEFVQGIVPDSKIYGDVKLRVFARYSILRTNGILKAKETT